jgi:hypothetical protein
MIGQQSLKIQINKLIENGFPRFTVITGQKGQGKKTLAKYIANKLKYPIITIDTKIDSIREMIELAYKQTEPIIYLIADADKMSIGAKNSLLKVIEEPPNNAYFIMTLQQIENTLETIKSRCIQLEMENYQLEELNKFIDEIDSNISSLDRAILQDCCQNKYQIELYIKYGVQEFYSYCKKVVDNIWRVQSANSFKIAEKLDLKSDGTGYDIELFLNTFREICLQRLLNIVDNEDEQENFKYYGNSITITSQTIQQLNINGINKTSLIDMWILSIRKIWRN